MESELQSSNGDYLISNYTRAESHIKLGNLYTKLTQYDLASGHLTAALKLYTYYKLSDKEMKLGNIEEKLADICVALHQYSLAHHHLTAALKLYENRRLLLKNR